MWTKLNYLSLGEALFPKKVNGNWRGAEISARYRAALRKEFLKAGVPWEWDRPKKPFSEHIFNKPPKMNKHIRTKEIKIARITKALQKQDELKLKHRQEQLNKKKPTGLDAFFASSLGNFIKGK